MPFTLRALSFGKIIKEAFALYGEHFFLFLGISAVPNLLLLMLQYGLGQIPAGRPLNPGMATLLAGLGLPLASLFASSIVTAATTVAVSDIYTDRLPDLWDSFARLSGKAFRVLVAAFLVELFVGVGTIFFIIPGIYFAGIYGMAIPVVVLENLGPKKALDRSEELTKDSTGRVILVFFLTATCTGLLVLALNAAASLGWTASDRGIVSKHVLNLVTTTVGGILFGPISAIALALEYYDLRVRFEGFNLQQLRTLVTTPENLHSDVMS